MGETLAVPVWLALPAALLAAWAAYDKLLMPCLRWMLARPADQVADELSTRLRIGIRPFQRTPLVPRPPPAGADPPPDDRPEGAPGGRAPRVRKASAAPQSHEAGRALRARDRSGLQRLPLLPHRLLGGTQARAVALPRAPRLRRHRGRRQDRPGCDRGVRDEPPLEHGLRPGGLPRRRPDDALLRRGRMGAPLAALHADPRHARLFHAPQLGRR